MHANLSAVQQLCAAHDRSPVLLPWRAAEHGCANETVALRNVGRETESFLWFIVQRYDSLAEYTLFTQAAPLAAAVSAPHSFRGHHAAAT